MKRRIIYEELSAKRHSKIGRILVFTGARQTGKTTLVRHCFDDYTYLAIDDLVKSSELLHLTAEQWKMLYPKAVLDEVQTKPALIRSISLSFQTIFERVI